VFPSLVEGFGLTALEAMACGLPVILSSNTFAEDVITDGVEGFIVPIRDSAAIAERLRLLAADPELRARMGAAARRTAEQHSWTRYGRQIVGIFRDLLPQPGSPQG
jgi:glycosyltransferase involved in cell wall biosynthesis